MITGLSFFFKECVKPVKLEKPSIEKKPLSKKIEIENSSPNEVMTNHRISTYSLI